MDNSIKYGFHDGILRLTIEGEFGAETITGWPQVREDLNLQNDKIPLNGVELKIQHENYRDGADFPFGYGPVMIEFEGLDPYKQFYNEISRVKRKRHNSGDRDGYDEVSDLFSRLPSLFKLKNSQ